MLLCACHTYCISIATIERIPGSFKDLKIINALKEYDATRPAIPGCAATDSGRDSAAALLLRLYHGWRNATQGQRQLKSELVSGLLLLRLGETGLDWPYDTARALLYTTARAYPENEIVAWMRGLRDIQSGELTHGIRLLDSLFIAGLESKTFLQDYGRSIAQALIPARGIPTSISLADTVPDTLVPVSYEWKITHTHRNTNMPELPRFSYGATFELSKPFHIVFSGLGKKPLPEIGLFSIPKPDDDLLSQYLNRTRTEKAHCRIFIDPNEPVCAIPEFIARRINGCYDSIDLKSDLCGLRGISLRCYTLPRRFSREEGTYTAIVSFDRCVLDKQYSSRLEILKKSATTVRYTLVVRSSLDAKDALEVKLQSLLRLF
jgi:hypothetical protein